MNTSITFVIPAYNSKSMLADAVESIFNGNFESKDEVIVVNDASKDTTGAVAEDLAKKYYPNIKLITNDENKGCPASRNIGISKAKNNLIFNLDADNILAQNSIGKLRRELVNQKADLVAFGEYHYFKTSPNDITHKWICKPGVFTLADFFSGIINQGPGGNFLYKKSVWEDVGGYWEYGKGLHEAWGFSLKLLTHGIKFIVLPNTFYYHRYSHQSLFIRENVKENEEIDVTNKFIVNFIHLFDEKSKLYIKNNPYWYHNLEYHPLCLKNGSIGVDGVVVHTSQLSHMRYTIKTLLKRLLRL